MKTTEATALIRTPLIEWARPQSWCDLGSGSGTFTMALAQLLAPGSTIYALDLDPKALKRIPDQRNGVEIRKIVADLQSSSLRLPSVDGVLTANTLHFIQEQQVFLRRLLSVTDCFLIVEYERTKPNPWGPYPLLDRTKRNKEGRYEEKKEMVVCTGHYTNQALRTLKVMQGKAIEWKVLRERPKITLADAPGRDRMIDDQAEDDLEKAYAEPMTHRQTKRMREQAWLVMVILQDSGMRPDEVFPMRIENILWKQDRIWIPEGKTDNARRHVAMSERMKVMLASWCGSRKAGWVFPSARSKSGHLTTIAKGFQAARNRAGLDKRLVPYSARHTYGTYVMEKSRNAFAVSKSMGHADLKSMEPYQHQELEPLRAAINQRNRRKKFGQVFGQVLENEASGANESGSAST